MPTKIPSVSTFTNASLALPFDPARNPTQAVSAWLTRDIVRGVFAPMEKLRAQHLSDFYRVGYNPIREGIIHLASTGLVVHEHQKGYRAAPVSLEDFEDVAEVFVRLYRMALGMALKRGDQAWEERVVVRLHRSLRVQKTDSADPEVYEIWQRAYNDLHFEMLSGCGSPVLFKLVRDVGLRAERYVNLFSNREIDRSRDSHSEHRAIVDALIARDSDGLRALIDLHFSTGRPMTDSIRDALTRGERPAPLRRAQTNSPSAVDPADLGKRRGRRPKELAIRSA